MEAGAEQASVGPWSTFSIVGSAMILIALSVAIFSTYRIDTPIEASMVRVANGTGLPLQNVSINNIFFGDVPVDGVSGYQALKPAYRYAALRLEVAGKEIRNGPRGLRRRDAAGPRNFYLQDSARVPQR
jgi:hypothetical protein